MRGVLLKNIRGISHSRSSEGATHLCIAGDGGDDGSGKRGGSTVSTGRRIPSALKLRSTPNACGDWGLEQVPVGWLLTSTRRTSTLRLRVLLAEGIS
jgi:hypothetical protein